VNPLVVLTEGFQSAFVACGVLAAIGVALAVVLLGQPPRAPQERLEPLPATGAAERGGEDESKGRSRRRRTEMTETIYAGRRQPSAP
jgi:hypothetical protein